MKQKFIFAMGLIVVSAVMLMSCDRQKAKNTDEIKTATIKVMYWNEREFFQRYGDLFHAKYPQIRIEVVSTYDPSSSKVAEDIRKLVDIEKPDVLFMDLNEYESFSREGKLYRIEPWIEKDRFDLKGVVHGLIGLLKDKGDGSLYGLAPVFETSVLYYNKNLFDRYGVPYPEEAMDWQQLLYLAKRFATNNNQGIYGLYDSSLTINNLFSFTLHIGQVMGLSYYNSQNQQLYINNKSWIQLFNTVLDNLRDNVIFINDTAGVRPLVMSDETNQTKNRFIQGNAAMTVDGIRLLGLLENNIQKGVESFQWGISIPPINPSSPHESGYFRIDQIFGINSESVNPDLAWEFVKYINSEEFAKKNRGSKLFLLSRQTSMQSRERVPLDPFYKLLPAESVIQPPSAFTKQFHLFGNEQVAAIYRKQLSVEQGLQSIESKGKQLLIKTE